MNRRITGAGSVVIEDLGLVRFFLGLEVARSDVGTVINQRKFALDILKDVNMLDCHAATFPLPRGLGLSIDEGDLLKEPEVYRRLVGRLLYLNITRPDLSFSVQHLSQFLSCPRTPHFQAALHVVRYLKGTLNLGLFYPAENDLILHGYSDADWAACKFSARSVSEYCMFLGSALVSWKTKKQKTVSKSSAESEYRSMSYSTSEVVWLHGLLADLFVQSSLPITLFCDNRAAQHIAANPVFHERTKHLNIDCHFVRDKVAEGFLQTVHVKSQLQLADLMTKALGEVQHKFFSVKLGLVDAGTSQA